VGTGNSSPERLSRPRQQAREETDSAGGEFQYARCLIGQPPTDPSHDLVAETESSTTSARCLIGQSLADLSYDLEAATETSVTRVRCLGDQPPTDLSHDRRCQAEEFISLSRPLVGQIFCAVAVVLMVVRWAMGHPTSEVTPTDVDVDPSVTVSRRFSSLLPDHYVVSPGRMPLSSGVVPVNRHSQSSNLLTSPPILGTPRDEGTSILDTDASDYALGVVLQQEQDGEVRVIAYASRALSEAEKRY